MARRAIALALIILLATVLPPRLSTAQNLQCNLAGPLPETVREFFGAPWIEERTISVDGVTLQLRFCAPMAQSVVAQQMLDLAELALPVLDELTNVRLDGSHIRTIYLDTSERVYSLNADGYINPRDEITLHPLSFDSTVVHELAHYWADRDRFREPWMVEAYAEYLTSLTMLRLGRSYNPPASTPACADLPLKYWQPLPRETAICAYAIGPQVLHDLAAAVGEAKLREVIGVLSLQPDRVSSELLLTYLERDSLMNLSPLMRDRVFEPAFHATLDERTAVRARFISAAQLAASLGATLPVTLAADLDAWRHFAAASQLADLEPVLHASEVTRGRCAELKLACEPLWSRAGPDPASWAYLGQLLSSSPQLLSGYEDLSVQAAELDLIIPASLQQAAASLSFEAITPILSAGASLTRLRAIEARCTRQGLSCRALWRTSWERGDSNTLMEHTGALGALLDDVERSEARCVTLGVPCRVIRQASFDAGELGAAQAGISQLNALLDDVERSEARCVTLGVPCRVIRQAGFREGEPGAAQAGISQLNALLDEAERSEASCAAAGWPCGAGWRARLADGSLSAARDLLAAQVAALPELTSIAAALSPAEQAAMLAGQASASDPLDPARVAFARGDIAEAHKLAEAALSSRWWGWVGLMAFVTLGFGGIVVTARLLHRRRRAQAMRAAAPPPTLAEEGADLLAQLLADPLERSDR